MSLRTRLLLVLGAVALVSLVIADVVTYQELRSFLYNGVDQALEASTVPVVGAIEAHSGPGPGSGHGLTNGGGPPVGITEGGPMPTSTCATFDGRTVNTSGLMPGTFIEVRSSRNAVVWQCVVPELGSVTTVKPTLPARITGFAVTGPGNGASVYFTADSRKPATQFRVRAASVPLGAGGSGQLILAVPLGGTVGTLDRLLRIELAVTGGALIAAMVLGWWLVRVGMHPLRVMERTAEAISKGQLDQRVPGELARTEVGRLARALNVMLNRIEEAFSERDHTEAELRHSEARMRQFVGDASHELRTPLAAVSAYAELFERGASTRPEDLQRVMTGIMIETARMGSLVEDLLLLARLDEGRPLDDRDVEVVGLTSEAVNAASAVGPQWPVRLEAAHPVEVTGDRMRLRQVIDNLLSNVRAHTPPGTPSVVTVAQQDGDMVMTVVDEGPGLSPEQMAHVFERFYRADPSRSRRHGGAGLGLAIVASIVRAHGGVVTVSSVPGQGSTFTVRIPVAGPQTTSGEHTTA